MDVKKMRILFISSVCSDSTFEYLNKYNKGFHPGGQKFLHTFVQGLAENINSLDVLSFPPVQCNLDKSYIKLQPDCEDNINYKYITHFRFLPIKFIINIFTIFFYTIRWCLKKENRGGYIVAHSTMYSMIVGNILPRILNNKFIIMICDLPYYTDHDGGKPTYKSIMSNYISMISIKKFDYYILITKAMNEIVNPKNKPYILIECFSDIKIGEKINNLKNKFKKNIIIYAGGIYKEYDVDKLIEAVILLDDNNIELWLYGNGDIVSDMQKYMDMSSSIKYKGIVSNEDVINDEIRATLLVNPRPSNKDFTKYSFPSKNMEYMSTGTPVLTTILPGIPEEYYNYCYTIKEQNVKGIASSIKEVLGKPREEIHAFGMDARKFVLNEKNNFTQTHRFITDLKNNFCLEGKSGHKRIESI